MSAAHFILVAVAAQCAWPAFGQSSAPTSQLSRADASVSAFALQREGAAAERVENKPDSGFWIWPSRPPVEGPLATDRPGFADTYVVLPRGYNHLEGGYTFSYDHEARSSSESHGVGEWALRMGLHENFEFRLEWSGYSFAESVSEGTSPWAGRRVVRKDHNDGALDMNIGFKSQFVKQDGLIPNLSIVPALYFPTGSANKTAGDVDPELRLAYNWAINDKLAVYGVGQVAAISDSEGRFAQGGASIAASYAFTPEVSGFVEYYGLYPSARRVDAQHTIGFGSVFLVNDHFQIDVRAGFGLNEEAPDFFTTIGFAIRF